MNMLRVSLLPQAIAAIGALLMLAIAPAHAQTATQAENYVQQNIEKGLQILNNQAAPDMQRRQQFRSFLLSLTDVQRIAKFTLGNARRTATPAQQQAFDDAFKDYAISIYESRLSKYSGQTLKVTGATARAADDYVVNTTLVDPNDADSRRNPLQVDFRVQMENGHFVIIDVAVAGVWLALEERDQFAAFLNEHNGDVGALARHLQGLAADLRSGAHPTDQPENNGH